MKTSFYCLVFCGLLSVGVVQANDALTLNQSTMNQPQMPSADEMAKHETDWMKTELTLSAEQLTLVSSINLNYAKKVKELFAQSNGDRESMHAKMEVLQSQKKDELAKILSADQLQKYVTYQASHKRGPRN